MSARPGYGVPKRTPDAGSPGFRSPISQERKLADDEHIDYEVSDSGSVSSMSDAEAPGPMSTRAAVLDRRYVARAEAARAHPSPPPVRSRLPVTTP